MSTIAAAAPQAPGTRTLDPIDVERWPTERPLFAAALFVSAVIWLLAIVSVVGLIYALILGTFFFIMHVGFVAHVRGSGVRLGPDQFPELHARVQTLAGRMGMRYVPEAYLMQAGGALNAFATRFMGANIVVLFSDLVEACGEDEAARDMILAHELGHIRAGHVRWHWVLLPASLVPFLGTALSRAREYTCDRFGLAGAGDRAGALLGLTILAAGGRQARLVNQRALVRQQRDLNTGWMTIGEWLSTHPPLSRRLAMLEPGLAEPRVSRPTGIVRALVILFSITVVFAGISWLVVTKVPAFLEQASAVPGDVGYEAPVDAAELVEAGFAEMAAFVDAEQAAGRPIPEDAGELYARWAAAHPGETAPVDPYDGWDFGYDVQEDRYVLWSSGPDRSAGTPDDLYLERPI